MVALVVGLALVLIILTVFWALTTCLAAIFEPYTFGEKAFTVFAGAFLTAWFLWGCVLLGKIVTG
jgi:hypothetical protein